MDIQVLVNGQPVAGWQAMIVVAASFLLTALMQASRNDAWCAQHPYLASVFKFFRSLPLVGDAGLLHDAISLFMTKKLPEKKT